MNAFIFECKRHVQQNPLDVIAVHCTHGFNRTGFLIAAFLIQTEDWSPEAAVEAFAKSRPPGIYKGRNSIRIHTAILLLRVGVVAVVYLGQHEFGTRH